MPFLLLTFSLLASLTEAPAGFLLYIDPGSGSMLFQLLMAGLLGGLYAVKMFWHRIVAFFRRLTGKKSENTPDGEKQP